MARIETASRNLIVVGDLTVNYDQTPAEAIEGMNNNSLIASDYPQALWSGGKSGVVEGVTIPIYWPREPFSISEGRRLQSEIGYGLPAELAALRDEEIRKALWDMGVWWIVTLGQSNEVLWQHGGDFRPVCLDLDPDYHGFNLDYADYDWGSRNAFVGAPQVPK